MSNGIGSQQMVVKLLDLCRAKVLVADFQHGAAQADRRRMLHGETHGFRGGIETAIGEAGPLLLADRGGKQFGGGVVAEGHDAEPQRRRMVNGRARMRALDGRE